MRKAALGIFVFLFLIAVIVLALAMTPADSYVKRSDVNVLRMAIINSTVPSALGLLITSADFNNDSITDLAINGVYANVSGGNYNYDGQVYIFYGSTSGFHNGNISEANVTLNGTMGLAGGFGISLLARDVNYDTYPDLIVGAHRKNVSGGSANNWGQVNIFYGSQTGLHSYTDAQANITINSTSPSRLTYGLSHSKIFAGYFNNDSYLDLVIGGTGKNLSGGALDYTGQVYVFYGSSDGFHSCTTAEANVTFNGSAVGGYFGATLNSGDFNNDSYQDLAVGAPYMNLSEDIGLKAGKTFIFYGSSDGLHSYSANEANVTFNGTDSMNLLGYEMYTQDINYDNITDLIVSAIGKSIDGISYIGQVYAYYGTNGIWHSGNASLMANLTLNGSESYSQFGWSLLTEDLNRDNRTDLIVGANLKNVSGGIYNYQGQVVVFYNTPDGLKPYSASDANITLNGTDKYEGFGYSTYVGDLNGDNIKELVVGAPYVNISGPRDGNAWGGQVQIFAFNFPPTYSTIPNQGWNEDSSITLNLSQYFADVNRDNLNYTWTGNTNIAIAIDETTNVATLTPNANWHGTEYVMFYANDSYNDLVASNNITLTVSNTADCGDNTCDSSESCSSCASDCGACPAVLGSSTAATEPKAAHTFTIITPEVPAIADFKNMAVSSITLTTDETATNVKVEVKEVSKTNVPMPETGVYKLIEIKASNIELKEAKIKFKVKLSWLEENDVGQGEVVLMHHKDSWERLETAYRGKDDENAYYEAKTGSLSMFAISYQKKESVKEGLIQEEPEQEEKTETLIEPVQPVKEKSVFLPIVISAIAALIIITIILKKKKH